MDKYKIVRKIEDFAPLETQESWDCSGWLVETNKVKVNKIMLCLTVTNEVIKQAKEKHCDMIISHHPLFKVPIDWAFLDIYCAHTNIDLARGGTTDVLAEELGFSISDFEGFLRYVDVNITLEDLKNRLRKISPNFRYVNSSKKEFRRLAFCAGSGSEFIDEAYIGGADAFITGDLKFHTAIESPISVFDIGHFESEIMVLRVFRELIGNLAEVFFADETSPFIYQS